MKARTFRKLMIIVLSVMFSASLFAQTPTDYVANAGIDSVTATGTINYFVMPDAAISPSYNYTTDPTANLNSTFDWSTTSGSPTFTDNNGANPNTAATNHVSFAWPVGDVGSQTVEVIEVANTTSCADATATTINVDVIAVPTTNYPAAGGTEAICATGTDGSITLTNAVSDINVAFASAVKGSRDMKLTYDLTCDNGSFSGVTDHEVSITETGAGTGTIALAQSLTHYGTYTVTLKGVTDRISVKSGVTGGLLNANTTFTITVSPTPTTGTIYHLPNL